MCTAPYYCRSVNTVKFWVRGNWFDWKSQIISKKKYPQLKTESFWNPRLKVHHFYLTKGSEKCFHVLPHTYSLGIISTSWITLCICYCIGCISTLYPTQFKLRPDLGEDHSRSWHSSYLYFKRAVQPVNFVHFSQVDNITEIFCKPNCQTRFIELKT